MGPTKDLKNAFVLLFLSSAHYCTRKRISKWEVDVLRGNWGFIISTCGIVKRQFSCSHAAVSTHLHNMFGWQIIYLENLFINIINAFCHEIWPRVTRRLRLVIFQMVKCEWMGINWKLLYSNCKRLSFKIRYNIYVTVSI